MNRVLRAKWIFACPAWLALVLAGSLLGGCASTHEQTAASLPRPHPPTMHPMPREGSVDVSYTTNGRGEILSARMVKSSGDETLDRYAVDFIKAKWHGPPNSSRTSTLLFRLQDGHEPAAAPPQ